MVLAEMGKGKPANGKAQQASSQNGAKNGKKEGAAS